MGHIGILKSNGLANERLDVGERGGSPSSLIGAVGKDVAIAERCGPGAVHGGALGERLLRGR